MANQLQIISADSHVYEPPDLWTKRIDAEFREQAPHVVHMGDFDMWRMYGGGVGISFGQGTQAGKRFSDPEAITLRAKAEELPPGVYDPHRRVEDLALDGVDGEVIFPTVSIPVFRTRSDALLNAIFRAYNSWLSEFCSVYPNRTKGIALINVEDVEEAVRELRRSRSMGLVGGMISSDPNPDPNSYQMYQLPKYEPIWATAEELAMPLCMHVGTARYDRELTWDGDSHDYVSNTDHLVWICKEVQQDHWVRRALTSMIFSGVFDRHPELQIGVVEHEAAWVPFFLYKMDEVYKTRQMHATYRFGGDLLPSDYFHSNAFVSFQEDAVGLRCRDVIGVDNMVWGNDYPHSESTFPRSRQIIDQIFAGMPEDEKRRILCGNAARLFHFETNTF